MSDLINGREMLKRYQEDLCYGIACKECSMCTEDGGCRVEEWIDKFPSADRPSAVDLSSVYSTAYKSGYEKGKADRPQGEWLKFGLGRGTRILFCTNCERRIEVPLSQGDSNYDFCPNCGCRMKGADDD